MVIGRVYRRTQTIFKIRKPELSNFSVLEIKQHKEPSWTKKGRSNKRGLQTAHGINKTEIAQNNDPLATWRHCHHIGASPFPTIFEMKL